VSNHSKLAILASGGPAPGINAVIGSATIRAVLSGVEVIGIQDGFRWLMEGDTSHVIPLTVGDTTRIHFRGGSHIGISRSNPTRTEAGVANVLKALQQLGVGQLITIGGDGTAYSAWRIAEAAQGALRIVHVPKTIDNDLDLPHDIPTFGFQTARHIGVELVENLKVDARTTSRWYFVLAQGRKAGHLALGIGKASGATITLIPEEFPRGATPLRTIVDTLAGSILRRLAYGRSDGVAVLAEGLVDCIAPRDLEQLGELPRDPYGNIHMADVDLAAILRKAVAKRLAEFNVAVTIMTKSIGYELRCADPIPFDLEYCRDLGYCAARYIIEGGSHVMVSMQDGNFVPIPFSKVIDQKTGFSRVRMIDLESDRYKIARTYMIRLREGDFDDPLGLARLAETVGRTPDQFIKEFGHLAEREPATMRLSVAPPKSSLFAAKS
jgi:ATP-dependent phosphofructokinase / diphosphate-dependent phosphofructokinase